MVYDHRRDGQCFSAYAGHDQYRIDRLLCDADACGELRECTSHGYRYGRAGGYGADSGFSDVLRRCYGRIAFRDRDGPPLVYRGNRGYGESCSTNPVYGQRGVNDVLCDTDSRGQLRKCAYCRDRYHWSGGCIAYGHLANLLCGHDAHCTFCNGDRITLVYDPHRRDWEYNGAHAVNYIRRRC